MSKEKNTLPTNRFESFKDISINQFRLLLKIGLLTLLIFIPLIIIFILTNIKVYEINLLLSDNLITDTEALIEINGYLNARNILFIVFIPITLYLLSGIFNIIRKTVWQEGVMFWYDYKKGLKNNGSYFLILGLIIGIIFFVFNYILREELVNHSISNLIALCFSIVALLILILFIPLLLHQTIIYNLKFTHKIKNAIIIFSKYFYLLIILGIINLIPIFLLFINNGLALILIIILDCILLIPLIIVINTLVTDSLFDAFINYFHFKEIYRKGLFDNAENNN